MATSCFRQPQFSEDVAWLPAWLQQHQESLSDEQIKAAQIPSQQACKDLVYPQRNFCSGEDVNLLTGEDARYKSCHLFLSGSENSPISVTPSSGNVLHFHLHLSSNGISQYTPSPVCDVLPRDKSNVTLSMQPLAKPSSDKMEIKDGMLGEQLKSKPSLSSSSRSLIKNNGKKHQEKNGRRRPMIADTEDAVELSIAASEALVISETVNSASTSKVFPASAVLEVALHLKQARNHWCTNGWENVSDCRADQVDETDMLQDLDEDSMADAYGDVGLSFSPVVASLGDLYDTNPVLKQICSYSGSVSRVPDTPGSGNHYGCDTEVQNVELKPQEVEFYGHSSQRNSEDVLQDKPTGDSHLVLNTSSAHLEPYLNLSAQTTSKVAPTPGVDIADGVLLHTQDLHPSNITVSSRVRELGNDENEVVYVVSDGFRSRWLGGWAMKDAGVSIEMDPNANRRVPEFIIRETSFISESADIFPDQNSFVNKPERISDAPSLSTVACEDFCNTPNKERLLSQNVAFSSYSSADPLCSVVPCSISSATADLTVGNNQNDIELQAGNYLNLAVDHGLENLHTRTSGWCDESGHHEGNMLKNGGEGSGAIHRKLLNSLKNYSMGLPPLNAHSEMESASCNGSVPTIDILEFPSVENIDCVKSSSTNDSTALLLSEPASKHSAHAGYEKGQEIFAAGFPVINLKNDTKHGDETANEAEFQPHHQENRCSPPLILKHGTRRRIQAPKIFISNAIGEASSERASVPEMINSRGLVGCVNRSLMASPPILHSSQHPNPCENQGPSKKRVRFSETLVNKFQKNKSGLKLQSEHQTRSSTGTAKRSKKFSLRPDLRGQGDDTWVKKLRMKDRKRLIFHGLEFFLTGFASQSERELEMLIRKHGGFVISDVPPPPNSRGYQRSRCKLQQLPILLSPKKLQTTKFLYGCALNAFMLKVDWLTDTVRAGSLLPPEKYMILPNRDKRIGWPVRCANRNSIFDKVGIMFHGKRNYCTKMANIVKHGGGQVFTTLQWLLQSLTNGKISLGTIVAEDEDRVSRHLRQCALEQNIPIMAGSWIIDSLHSGKLVTFKENKLPCPSLKLKIPDFATAMELSPEI